MSSNENREAGKRGCHAQGYTGKAAAALRDELQPRSKGTGQVGDTAIATELLGQHVSETSGR